MKKILRTFVLLVIILILNPITSSAQEIYLTAKGVIYIKGKVNNNSIVARSDNLAINLDYETADFTIKLDKSTLKTGIDSLDKKLDSYKNDFITFTGNIGLEYIKTQKHKPLDFVVEGYIDSENIDKNIVGYGRLVHVFGDYYSCILSMNFNINLKESGFDINIPGFDDIIQVKIIQTLLER